MCLIVGLAMSRLCKDVLSDQNTIVIGLRTMCETILM